MTPDWTKPTYTTITEQTVVTPGPLTESLHHLRAVVPSVQTEHDPSGYLQFRWHHERSTPSQPLGTCFWDLIELADGADADLVRFVERYGPLVWTHETQDGVIDAAGERGASWLEPLWAWRNYARALKSLFAMVDARGVGESLPVEEWLDAIAAVAIPIILRSGSFPKEPPTGEDFLAVLSEHNLDGRHGHPAIPFDQIVTAALRLAGVGMAFVADSADETPAFALPATVLQPARSFADMSLWQVRGLLPILAIALAIELRAPERGLCTWCGKPAAIIGRRRRRGHAWFGDHEDCRAEARSIAMRRAKTAYRERRKSADSD